MIATSFDMAMFLSRGGDCVPGDRAVPLGSSANGHAQPHLACANGTSLRIRLKMRLGVSDAAFVKAHPV